MPLRGVEEPRLSPKSDVTLEMVNCLGGREGVASGSLARAVVWKLWFGRNEAGNGDGDEKRMSDRCNDRLRPRVRVLSGRSMLR